MKISNSFKISTFNLKPFESKRPFLIFMQILSAKHFSPVRINETDKIKSHIRNELFQNTQNGNFQVK